MKNLYYIIEKERRYINYMQSKETIVIFTAKKARNLLKKGYTIVDIKPDKTDIYNKRSVFVFKNEPGILDEE